ncbi:hypothetical protein SDRG_05934 [Saprolegnia diclina VS20]|uniref:Transmembrane protein n=1 Tax=Saprolegnia diclina (strain VS20) TaxID=1156394 RepID=T0QRF0_SAPDV|nr:hypothetical protein SDRG_05934 [Saprolegnia diclina VS20]EQC36480.1 hypothetical protein SDRG_05934 [Saprolegnia diclina VS20]|eukprot:XP_008609901.1 hypothetical protein SDRG_05934 [Saprolegnia diclina VS20]
MSSSILVNVIDANGSYIAQEAYTNLVITQGMIPVPSTLDVLRFKSAGSNFLCNALPSAYNVSTGLSSFVGIDVPCNTAVVEWVAATKEQLLFALITSGVASQAASLVPLTCSIEGGSVAQCLASLTSVAAYIQQYVSTAWIASIEHTAVRVQDDITALDVQFITYLQDVTTLALSLFQQPILDAADAPMRLAGWTYAYDWATGTREVIAFDGDVQRMTVLSTSYSTTSFVANAAEVPVNVAAYLRVFCQYISFMLLLVGALVILYTVLNQFTSEGWNLLELNRVGGLVWIGRPLLFLRSISALCILSTATLQLQVFGGATRLISKRNDVSAVVATISDVLAAGELGWLIYIFDDICMVVTQQYSASYVTKSAVSGWIAAAALRLVSPVTHSASVHWTCNVAAVDYQVVCDGGAVVIGRLSRLLLLIAIALGGSMGMYLHDRLRYSIPPPLEQPSCLVSCGAKYLFEKHGWVVDGIVYIDFASALLTGLLVWPRNDTLYVFDIKTWRTLVVRRDASVIQGHPRHNRLASALPLTE